MKRQNIYLEGMKSLTFYRWHTQHASGSDSQGENKSIESFRSTCAHQKRQTAVSSFCLEVRSFETFSFFDRRRLSPEKKLTLVPPSWITQRMEVLHFKHKMWPKNWFSSVPNGLFIKKRLYLTYICRIYVRTFEQEEKKRRGSSTAWNCLARSLNVYDKRRTWPLRSGHVTPRRLRSNVFRNKRGSKTP